MRIAIVSPYNYYGLPHNLAKQLNLFDGVQARSYTYHKSSYGFETDTVLANLTAAEFGQVIKEIKTADIIHVFDQAFNTENFHLEEHLKANNAIYTYTPDYFSKADGEIFFRHYQTGILATADPLTKGLSSCPVPLVHMPPMLDFDSIPQSNAEMPQGPSVAAYSSHYGKRGLINPLLQMLFEMQEQIGITINWMENLDHLDYLHEISMSEFYLDDLTQNGLSPVAMEAMATGVAVVANMTGLDFSLYPKCPAIPATPDTLLKTLAFCATQPEKLKQIGQDSANWIKSEFDPEKVGQKWISLYRHVKANGAPLAENPFYRF